MATAPGSAKLSVTVGNATKRLTNGKPVHAIDYAREILRSHTGDYAVPKSKIILEMLNRESKNLRPFPDYVSSNAAKIAKSEGNTVEEWLELVKSAYDWSKTDELHGRLALIGLSLFDDSLRSVMIEDGFLGDIIKEVKEFDSILSSIGREKYNLLIGGRTPGFDDHVENLGDTAVEGKAGDQLDRYNFAEFLVKLLSNTNLSQGSYALHLYAPWGAGKTSVLNFMKGIFNAYTQKDGKKNWHVVDFNAWQNQRLAYPWWTLMKSIRKEVKSAIPRKERLREWWWRFRISKLPYLVVIVIISWMTVLLLIPYLRAKSAENNPRQAATVITSGAGKDKKDETITSPVKEVFENIDKTIAAIVSISAVFIALSNNVMSGTQKAAKNYMDAENDPMATLQKRFKQMVTAIAPAKIVVFIDDLDRCKSAYVVDLLENIQTLFKEANVVFIIAADVKWIHGCYEVEYEKIKAYVLTHGKPIGPLFVEKMFQLSVALPGVAASVKERLWSSLLALQQSGQKDETEPVIPAALTVEARENLVKEANAKPFAENHAMRLEMVKKLADKQTLVQTEHFLQPYSVYLDLNPRSMKRLLNSYTVNKATSLISHIDITAHQLALWTILATRWPILADYLLENPEMLAKESKTDTALPDPIKGLWNQQEVQTVIKASGIKGSSPALSQDTLRKCRELFV